MEVEDCPTKIHRDGETRTDALPIGNGKLSQKRSTARMPVDRDDLAYNMNHLERGKAIIFNHENFDKGLADKREGTDEDVRMLIPCLKDELGFDVEVHNDLTIKQIKQRLKELSKEDHTNRDCVLVTVFSHGQDNGRIFSRDTLYHEDKLFKPFYAEKCPILSGKPKPRKDVDPGIELTYVDSSPVKRSSEKKYTIPIKSDMFIFHSTAPGDVSFRSDQSGTCFIRNLVHVLQEY